MHESQLRGWRNRQLAETDSWMLPDRNLNDEQLTELETYRQALRDVPNNNTPAFDENEDITGVTWPTKPE